MTWDRTPGIQAAYDVNEAPMAYDDATGALNITGPRSAHGNSPQQIDIVSSGLLPMTALFYHTPGDGKPFDARASLFHMPYRRADGIEWYGELGGGGGGGPGGLTHDPPLPIIRTDFKSENRIEGESEVFHYDARGRIIHRFIFPWDHRRLTHYLGGGPFGKWQEPAWFTLIEKPTGAPRSFYSYVTANVYGFRVLAQFWFMTEGQPHGLEYFLREESLVIP